MNMKRVKLSSAQRATGSTSIGDFRLALSEPLDGRYKLVELFLCNSAYNIDATNNVIYWNESGGSGDLSATVTPGYYSAPSLATAVAAAMTTATGTGSVFTGAYSGATGKIAFTSTPSTPLVFSFDVHTTNSIGAYIGYVGGEDPALGGTLVANVAPLLSYNIQVNGVAAVVESKGNGFSFVIPANANSLEYILYHPHPSYVQQIIVPRASTVGIRVVNDAGTTITLLSDWYMILEQVC